MAFRPRRSLRSAGAAEGYQGHSIVFFAEMEVSINDGTQNGWFIVENPTKMDHDWGYPPISENHQISGMLEQNLMVCLNIVELRGCCKFHHFNGRALFPMWFG